MAVLTGTRLDDQQLTAHPGGFVQITYDALGKRVGVYVVPARSTSDQTLGTTTERVTLTVT